MGITYIPYDPQTDPKQYLSQALQQTLGGQVALRQKRQFQKGLGPTMTPMQLFQKALSSGYPVGQALQMSKMSGPRGGQGFTLSPGQTRFGPQGRQIAKGAPKEGKKAKVYDVKTLNETLWQYTHEKIYNDEGKVTGIREKKPSKNDLFTLKKMAKQSGLRLRRMTTEQLEKKKVWWLPGFLEGKEKVSKTHWVLESATGEIMPPVTAEPSGPLLTGDDVPEAYKRLGVTEYRPPSPEVPAGLEDLWDSMSEEEKETALQHLNAGTATIQQIKDLLK